MGVQPTSTGPSKPRVSEPDSKFWCFQPDIAQTESIEDQFESLLSVFQVKSDLFKSIPSVELIQISFVSYQNHYNCAFMLTADQVRFIENIGAQVVVDMYALGDDNGEEE